MAVTRPYDPWQHVAADWPEIEVVTRPLPGLLLGELRPGLIVLRAGTSAAQRRCTLAHEIVHLERGPMVSGPWCAREERVVHAEAARRLVRLDALADAVRELGGDTDPGALARLLAVDGETLRLRLQLLDPAERAVVRATVCPALAAVA